VTERSVDPAPSGELRGAQELTEEDALALLGAGEVELEGRLVDASNTTLRAFLTVDGVSARCVYKPVRGERPLWDFPDGTLAGREVSAYLVSRAGGWDLVPPTVLRDGPLGPGAVQLWIDEVDDGPDLVGFVPRRRLPAGWFPILSVSDEAGHPYALAHADDPRLAAMAVFDVVANNADRKGGHVLAGAAGRVYGVDHGVCFHVQNKLRTILWGWAGEPLPEPAREPLHRLSGALAGELGGELVAHLTAPEVAALGARVGELLASGRFPKPAGHRTAVPWPPI
jgi:uncharacterized repeat protein (TIGR03843 family)